MVHHRRHLNCPELLFGVHLRSVLGLQTRKQPRISLALRNRKVIRMMLYILSMCICWHGAVIWDCIKARFARFGRHAPPEREHQPQGPVLQTIAIRAAFDIASFLGGE